MRSGKDGNTGVGTNECGGNQFVPINGGEKKHCSLLATFSPHEHKNIITRALQMQIVDYLMFAQDDRAEKCTRMPEARA